MLECLNDRLVLEHSFNVHVCIKIYAHGFLFLYAYNVTFIVCNQILVCLFGIFSAIPRELYTTARSFWCLSLHAAGPESPGEADPSD